MTYVVWPAGKNNTLGFYFLYNTECIFGICVRDSDANLPQSSADKVCCLSAKINNDNHRLVLYFFIIFCKSDFISLCYFFYTYAGKYFNSERADVVKSSLKYFIKQNSKPYDIYAAFLKAFNNMVSGLAGRTDVVQKKYSISFLY